MIGDAQNAAMYDCKSRASLTMLVLVMFAQLRKSATIVGKVSRTGNFS